MPKIAPSHSPAKRGPRTRTIYSRVVRVAIPAEFAHLIPFFKKLDALPRGRRNLVLLTALDHGAAAAQSAVVAQTESVVTGRKIDAFLEDL